MPCRGGLIVVGTTQAVTVSDKRRSGPGRTNPSANSRLHEPSIAVTSSRPFPAVQSLEPTDMASARDPIAAERERPPTPACCSQRQTKLGKVRLVARPVVEPITIVETVPMSPCARVRPPANVRTAHGRRLTRFAYYSAFAATDDCVATTACQRTSA